MRNESLWRPELEPFEPWKPPPPFEPFKPEPLPKPPPLTLAERIASRRKPRRKYTQADTWRAMGLPPSPPPQADWKPVYLRFGPLTGAGRSLNFEVLAFENGVSVFGGYVTSEGDYLVDLEGKPYLAANFIGLHYLWKRPVFVVEGRQLEARGSGGEPLLSEVTSCKPVPDGANVAATVEIPERLISALRARTAISDTFDGVRNFAANVEFGMQRVRAELGLGTRTVDSRKIKLPMHMVNLVTSRATSASRKSSLHGPEHWKRVALAGCELLKETPGVNPIVVFLFALFHDAARFNDAHDPEHGARAAVLALGMRRDLYLSKDDRADLEFICHYHSDGHMTDNPTAAVCWDADRLNLWRVGIQPNPKLLSTEAARDPERIEWARKLQTESFSWEEICQRYVDTVEELRRA